MNAGEIARTWHLETFAPVTADDCLKIGFFLASQNPDRDGASFAAVIRWKLCENEVQPGFASAMVTDDTAQIVSTCSVTPKRLWCDGKVQLWSEIGDTFTVEQFQRKGMFSALVNASRSSAQNSGFEIVYGLPNSQSAPGYLKKLEFAIKENAGLRNCSLPLSTIGVVPRLGDRIPNAVSALLLSQLLTGLSRIASHILTWRPQNREVEILETLEVSDEFDQLWEAVRGALPIAQVRDARYVDWRYIRHPLPFRIYTARIDGVLRGYLVTLLIDQARPRREKRLWIIDWLFAPTDSTTVGRALLDAAMREATRNDVDIVGAQTSASTPLPLLWRRYGFMLRPLYKPVIVHKTAAGRRFLERDDPWHYTLSDTDGF